MVYWFNKNPARDFIISFNFIMEELAWTWNLCHN